MAIFATDALSPLDLKLIAIGVVSVGCTGSGLLPVCCGLGNRHSSSLLMSAALCFGGGVLLATSIVHILPDVEKGLPDSKWSQLVFCLGYLLIYFLDVIVQIVTAPSADRPATPLLVDSALTYGTIGPNDDHVSVTSGSSSSVVPTVAVRRSKCTNFSLLLAFSIHSFLEGLVIGVEQTTHGVLLLLLAVCSHKIIVSFCLGAELSCNGRSVVDVLPFLLIFIFGSDIGIALGAFIDTNSSANLKTAIPILQGLAGGTLLYVVVSEILPRERSRLCTPIAGLVQFVAVCIGFGVMVLFSMLNP